MYCTWRRYIARVEEETVELGEKNVDRERERSRTQQTELTTKTKTKTFMFDHNITMGTRRTGLCTYTALKTNEEATI